MAKLSQADVKAKADEWAGVVASIEKLEKKRNDALAPAIAKHEKAVDPIMAEYEPKLSKLYNKRDEINAEVIGWLKDQKKSVIVAGDKGVATFFKGKRPSKDRVVNVQSFLGFLKTKGDAIYGCMTVAIKKAEELIGKTELDKICSKPDKDVEEATLTLK